MKFGKWLASSLIAAIFTSGVSFAGTTQSGPAKGASTKPSVKSSAPAHKGKKDNKTVKHGNKGKKKHTAAKKSSTTKKSSHTKKSSTAKHSTTSKKSSAAPKSSPAKKN